MNKPRISVIIPVHNDYGRLRLCLDALENQSFRKDFFEIIVVDNRSSKVPQWIMDYPGLRFFQEDTMKSSYAARNHGIKHASGAILAFMDADCIPDENWLQNAEQTMEEGGIDLLAGAIIFQEGEEAGFFKKLDSKIHLQQKANALMGSANTANLFVRKALFEKFGLFPQWQSVADTFWTHSASDGKTVQYSANSIVYHPTRDFWALVKKRVRIGKGLAQSRASQNLSFRKVTGIYLRQLKMPSENTLKYFPQIKKKSEFYGLYFMLQISNLVCFFSSIANFLRK